MSTASVRRQQLSLAATVRGAWYEQDVAGPLKCVADFGLVNADTGAQYSAGAGVADAVGTLALESWPGQTIGWIDELGDTQTSLAVTSALDGASHEFVIPDAPRGRYRAVYTSTSDGLADYVEIYWG